MSEEPSKHPPLKNHPDQPFPIKKKGLKYVQVQNVSRNKKWGWTALGPNGCNRLQEHFYTSTLKKIRAEIADHLVLNYLDEITIYYDRKEVAQAWALTCVKERIDMHEPHKKETPSQSSLWSIGMTDQAQQESIYDYGWTNFTYKTFKTNFTSMNKAYLFVKKPT